MDPSIIELTKKLERTEAILTALYQGELDAIVRASDIALIRNESSVRNTEYALEETRNNFQLLFNSLEDLLFIIDNNGNIIHHNIAVEQYLGYESDELTKMNFLQLHRQEDRSQLQKLMTPNAKEKLVQNRLLKKNGDLIYAETRLSQGAWSKKVVWFAIVRDITIRKQAEFEMKAAQKAAEDANKAKTEFFAKMTHELRTPLNGILGYSQMLIGDKSLKPSNQKAATIIHSSGEYLLSLINDLLDFSKIEAQQMKLYSESFDLQQMIQHVSELTIIGAQKKNITYSTHVHEDIPKIIVADEKRLRQVLLNILSNAIKFTEKGQVCFHVYLIDSRLRFEVKDTGCGIPEDKQFSLFQPFHSIKGTDINDEGTGLGLYISRILVRMMGSDINIKSVINKGTTVWFDLPDILLSGETQKPDIKRSHSDTGNQNTDIPFPPDRVLHELIEFTMAGDVSGIMEWTDIQSKKLPTFKLFFQMIRDLASKLHLTEIQRIAEKKTGQ